MPNTTATYYWFCSISPQGRRSRVAHAVANGKTLCNTQVTHGTRSFTTPEGAGAVPCKRCQKAMQVLRASIKPLEVVLKCMTLQADKFYVLEVDGQLYYFDYKWWCGKYANDPDDWAVGVAVPQQVLARYDLRTIPNAPTITLSEGWRPAC